MSELITPENVFIDVDAASVDDVLKLLADKAVALGYADDVDAVLAAFKHREELGSTGMAAGFALPHAKDDSIKKPGVFVVKLAHEVEWKTTDDDPVTIALGLVMPGAEAGTTHLHVLAQVSTMLMHEGVRAKLAESNDPAEIAQIVSDNLDD